MKLQLVNVSVVLVGQTYNPMVFTPDFLRSTKIVGKEWELLEQPVQNPLISFLRYSNGINVVIEPDRIQVVDNKPPRDIKISAIGSITQGLLKHLAYARHRAVGHNIAALIEHEDAAAFLRQQFIKKGTWGKQDFNDINLGFVYPKEDCRLNLTLASGTAKFTREGMEHKGIVITANYHTDIPTTLTLDGAAREARRQIARLVEHNEDFHNIMPQIFDLEGENNDPT